LGAGSGFGGYLPISRGVLVVCGGADNHTVLDALVWPIPPRLCKFEGGWSDQNHQIPREAHTVIEALHVLRCRLWLIVCNSSMLNLRDCKLSIRGSQHSVSPDLVHWSDHSPASKTTKISPDEAHRRCQPVGSQAAFLCCLGQDFRHSVSRRRPASMIQRHASPGTSSWPESGAQGALQN
jgi:hypothetical protein